MLIAVTRETEINMNGGSVSHKLARVVGFNQLILLVITAMQLPLSLMFFICYFFR